MLRDCGPLAARHDNAQPCCCDANVNHKNDAASVCLFVRHANHAQHAAAAHTFVSQKLRFEFGEVYTVSVSSFFGCEAPSSNADQLWGDVSVTFSCDPANKVGVGYMVYVACLAAAAAAAPPSPPRSRIHPCLAVCLPARCAADVAGAVSGNDTRHPGAAAAGGTWPR
jgi:hypothetical protein